MIANHLYRWGNRFYRVGIPGSAVIFKGLIRLICNCAIDPRTEIGTGTTFAYGGISVVIHRSCKIGKNVTIAQCVTIGGRSGSPRVPRIEDDVYIGAGAIILGDITIFKGAVVGAGSVVISDIGPGEVWAGVPAKKIQKRQQQKVCTPPSP